MDNVYNCFSKYFREIITATGRLKEEELLMNRITQYLTLKKDEPILDAACGTGEALNHLNQMGYKKIEGLDSSINMILRAKEKLPDIIFHHFYWEQLKCGYLTNQYKLIYIIGVSLLHAEMKSIPTIIESIYHLLLPTGVFVLDVRKWGNKDQNGVIQKNRPIDKYKKICEFELGGNKYFVEDKCIYTKERQHIQYKISCPSINKSPFYYNVSYARLSADYFKDILLKTGFKDVNIREESCWPYILIYAYK